MSLLGLHRSNVYYEAVPDNVEHLRLMRLIDEEYLRHPFLGSRRMVLWLGPQGTAVNRKRMQQLRQNRGFRGLLPDPEPR